MASQRAMLCLLALGGGVLTATKWMPGIRKCCPYEQYTATVQISDVLSIEYKNLNIPNKL